MDTNDLASMFIDFLGHARRSNPIDGIANINNFIREHNVDESKMEIVFIKLLGNGGISGDWNSKLAILDDKTYKKWSKTH